MANKKPHGNAGKGNKSNLRPPWKPGESGNPSGRPKRRPITDCYIRMADQEMPPDMCTQLGMKRGSSFADALARGQFIKAIKGEAKNASEIREAIEGKATQPIAVSAEASLRDLLIESFKPSREDGERLFQREKWLSPALIRSTTYSILDRCCEKERLLSESDRKLGRNSRLWDTRSPPQTSKLRNSGPNQEFATHRSTQPVIGSQFNRWAIGQLTMNVPVPNFEPPGPVRIPSRTSVRIRNSSVKSPRKPRATASTVHS